MLFLSCAWGLSEFPLREPPGFAAGTLCTMVEDVIPSAPRAPHSRGPKSLIGCALRLPNSILKSFIQSINNSCSWLIKAENQQGTRQSHCPEDPVSSGALKFLCIVQESISIN